MASIRKAHATGCRELLMAMTCVAFVLFCCVSWRSTGRERKSASALMGVRESLYYRHEVQFSARHSKKTMTSWGLIWTDIMFVLYSL
jgi:hypothetical protein